jgi:hypothetical protein
MRKINMHSDAIAEIIPDGTLCKKTAPKILNVLLTIALVAVVLMTSLLVWSFAFPDVSDGVGGLFFCLVDWIRSLFL